MSVDLKQMTELKNVKFLMMDFRVNESKKLLRIFLVIKSVLFCLIWLLIPPEIKILTV